MVRSITLRALLVMCAGLAAAQLPTLPSCATSCLANFQSGSSIAGCSSLDIVCICSNQSFLGGIACCLAGQCSVSDQQAATQYALSFCKAAGVTNLPTSVSCTSTSTSAGTSPSATAGAATSASPTSTSASQTGTNSMTSTRTSLSTAAATQTANGAAPRKSGVDAGLLGGLVAMAVFL